jgi:hypothetical protein
LRFPKFYFGLMTSVGALVPIQLSASNGQDPGLQQSGLATAIAASVALLPEDLQGMFWANIGLIGGTTKFPGFHERLQVHHFYIVADTYMCLI